ncbi:MAG TPA: helix-turn-helix domain-containing protein [Pyrinomonadaceae bacterium]
MDKRIAMLKEEMSSDLQKKWDVKELAQIINLSQPHLLNLFKIHTGTSPIHYLRELRLEKSRELLENSFLQIKQISFQIGMADQSHFVRDFKEKYGV